MPNNDWMGAYQDRKLGEMHLPGSHDAGTAKDHINLTFFGTKSNSATQTLTIQEQLEAGTRFFDLRLTASADKIVAHHTTLGQGACSETAVNAVLLGASNFCRAHGSEVVIFRISHTKASTLAHAIVMRNGRDQLHKGAGNLCAKTLREITSQGGLVCIFDATEFREVINQGQGIHGFTKYRPGQDPPSNGIACCGCYSGTHKLANVVCNGLKGQYEHNHSHNPHRHDHLWQLYWQKTYINPLSLTGIEKGTTKDHHFKGGKIHGGTHSAIDHMIGLMKGQDQRAGEDYEVQKEKKKGVFTKGNIKDRVMYSTLPVRNYTLPNIFSYDFVNEETNRKIIALNDKGRQAVELA